MQSDPRLTGFLRAQDLSEARIQILAGDASPRKYWRVQTAHGPRVIMDADPATGEDVARFARLSRHLSDHGFSAPAIHAEDPTAGFLLLEDFGDGLYSSLLAADPASEATLYSVAIDVLLALRDVPAGDLPVYDAPAMAQAVDLAFTEYLGALSHDDPQPIFTQAQSVVQAALDDAPQAAPVLCLRDYHAENIFWLPGRAGIAQAGLIDFQDAVLTHPAYDLASLLFDVRREVAPATQAAMITRYCVGAGWEKPSLEHALAVMSAQRNLRILGVFTRLARARGKPGYLQWLPRVWSLMNTALAHPELSALRSLIHDTLPEPTEAVIERLTRP